MNNIYMRRTEFPNLFSGEIDINRVAFEIFGFKVFWYALIIAFGLILAVVYCTKRGKKFGLTSDDIFDVALFGGLAGFLGARIFYVIFRKMHINTISSQHSQQSMTEDLQYTAALSAARLSEY